MGGMIWEYKINKGEHRSQFLIGSRNPFRRCNEFSVKIDKAFADGQSQNFVSKVFGYSDALHHHKNSIRVGIRHNPLSDRCMFYAYYYLNGVRHFHVVTEQDYDTWVDCSLHFRESSYHLKIGDIRTVCHREGNCKTYAMYPYYGGKYPAKNDFSIWIQYY